MAAIIPIISGGVSGTIAGSIEVNGVLNDWEAVLYTGPAPIQVAGLNNMTPCDVTDCRQYSDCSYVSPVFGVSGEGATYENDCNTFMVVPPTGYTVQFVIQKIVKGIWTQQAVVSNNDYGTYYPLGSITELPNNAAFTVNWGKILAAWGPGKYRIITNNCIVTYTQATLTIVIPSWTGNQTMLGTFTIGNTVYTIDYYGTYTGYLNYLASIINGNYTAVTTSNGITISGTNGNLSNNTQVSQFLSNTQYSFFSYLATSLVGGDGLSASSTNGSLSMSATLQKFSNIYYDNGSCYASSIFTAGVGGNQVFEGQLNIEWEGIGFTDITSSSVGISLYKNGSLVQRIVISSGAITLNYSYGTGVYNATVPFVFNSVNCAPGDEVELKVDAAADFTTNGGAELVFGTEEISFWQNVPQWGTTTKWGELTGGGEPVYNCNCSLASQPFNLMPWNCQLARGTVKFESYISGSVGDAFNPGNYFDFEGFTLYDSIRVPGFFGNAEMEHSQVMDEWGQSLSEPLGFIQLVRDKIVPKYYFKSKEVPLWVYKALEFYAFMANINLYVSDYNSNNADWDIEQKRVVLKGNLKVKYLNKGHFDNQYNYVNRMLIFEGNFEEGIQSGIMSNCDI